MANFEQEMLDALNSIRNSLEDMGGIGRTHTNTVNNRGRGVSINRDDDFETRLRKLKVNLQRADNSRAFSSSPKKLIGDKIGGSVISDKIELEEAAEEIKEAVMDYEKTRDSLKNTLKTAGSKGVTDDNFLDKAEDYLKKIDKEIELQDKLSEKIKELQKDLSDKNEEAQNLLSSLSLSEDELDKIKNFDYKSGSIDDFKKELTTINDDTLKKIYDSFVAIKEEEGKIADETDKLNRAQEASGDLDEKKLDVQNKILNTIQAQTNEIKSVDREQQLAISKFSKGLTQVKDGFTKILNIAEDLYEPWARASQAASKFAKSIGASAAGMAKMRSLSINETVDRGLGINYNVSPEELIEMQQDYSKISGRNILANAENREDMAAMRAVMGNNGAELAAQLENFGLSYSDAAKTAGKMFKEAGKYGVNFEKYSDNVTKNLKIAQNYTFKNGTKGLESMAKKATAIKLDMQQIANFAEKVNSVQGAVETGAKLQVLGGPFAQFADPMGMLNESLNDMEGLYERFEGMIGGLGRFDSEKGEIAVSSFNKQRIRAAAEAMGMDYGQVMESVQAKGRQNFVGEKILAQGYSKEDSDFIKNVAQVENGQATVSINGERVNLAEGKLSEAQLSELKKENQSDSENIRDIAKMLRGAGDVKEGFKKQLDATKAAAIENSGIGGGVQEIMKRVGTSNFLLSSIWASMAVLGGINAFGGMAGGFGNIFRGGKAFKNLGNGGKKVAEGVGKKASKVTKLGAGKAASKKGIATLSKAVRKENVQALRSGNGVIKTAAGKEYKVINGAIQNSKGTGALVGKVERNVLGAAGGKPSIFNKIFKTTTGEVRNFGNAFGIGGKGSKSAQLFKKIGNSNIVKKIGNSNIVKNIGNAKVIKNIGGKVAKNSTMVAKGANVLGWAGLAGDLATDWALKKGKMKKGGVANYGARIGSGMASGAAMGAMIGSIVPGIGNAVGAIVGTAIGAVNGLKKAGVDRLQGKIEDKTGLKVQGSYGYFKMHKIDKALETGEISDKLRRKLERKGDTDILNKIDERKQQIEAENMQAKVSNATIVVGNTTFADNMTEFANGGYLSNISQSNTSIANNFINKKYENGGYLNGPSHANGGMPILGSNIDVEGGEFVVNKKSTAKHRGLLESINREQYCNGGIIKPIQMKTGGFIQVSSNPNSNSMLNRGTNTLKMEPININFNGSIKLEGGNGMGVDITSELLKSPVFIRKITKLIEKQIGINERGGQVVNKGLL